jgi:hypothetical protein
MATTARPMLYEVHLKNGDYITFLFGSFPTAAAATAAGRKAFAGREGTLVVREFLM